METTRSQKAFYLERNILVLMHIYIRKAHFYNKLDTNCDLCLDRLVRLVNLKLKEYISFNNIIIDLKFLVLLNQFHIVLRQLVKFIRCRSDLF